MEPMQFAYIGFLILLGIGVILYMYPRYAEGFTTIALNTTTFPKCVARDADAQDLLEDLATAQKGFAPSSNAATAYAEFALIVSKLLCIDADVTSSGAGEYSTLRMPFSTYHDMEPVGSFVGRCLKNAVRQRDLDLTFEKLQTRGNSLLDTLCHNQHSRAKAITMFDTIVKRTQANVESVCLKEHSSMDVPAGVRDPGYYTPPEVQEYAPYQNTAPKYHF
jgi:hypothetical protein